MAAAFVLLRLNERTRVKGDAAIAMFSTTAVAVGAIVISMTKGMGEVSDYLFGKILSLTDSDVVISIALCVAVLAIFIFLYHRVFAITFDEPFARATGTRVGALNTLIALLTAVTLSLIHILRKSLLTIHYTGFGERFPAFAYITIKIASLRHALDTLGACEES